MSSLKFSQLGLASKTIGLNKPLGVETSFDGVLTPMPSTANTDYLLGRIKIGPYRTLLAIDVTTNAGPNAVSNGYYVSWGDGSPPELFASGTVAEHEYIGSEGYSYNTKGTKYAYGFVEVYPAGDDTLDTIDLSKYYNDVTANSDYNPPAYSSAWLQLEVVSNSLTAFTVGPISSGFANGYASAELGSVGMYRMGYWEGIYTGDPNTTTPEIPHRNLAEVYFRCPNVVDGSYMFQCCTALRKLDIDTSNMEIMHLMFANCIVLRDASSVTFESCVDASGVFQACSILTVLPSLYMPKVAYLDRAFAGCDLLVDFSLTLTGACIDVSYMFAFCNILRSVVIKGPSVRGPADHMFEDCLYLTRVAITNVSSITSAEYLFQGCDYLRNIPDWNFISCKSIYRCFYQMKRLSVAPKWILPACTDYRECFSETAIIEGPNWDMPSGERFYRMFRNCKWLERCSLYFPSDDYREYVGVFEGCHWLEDLAVDTPIGLPHGNYFLNGCHSIEFLPPVTYRNTTGVTNVYADSFNLMNSLVEYPGFIGLDTDLSQFTTSPYSNVGPKVSKLLAPICEKSFTVDSCVMTSVGLNELYESLPVVTSKTITITNVDDDEVAASDTTIATDKGWTVNS